jgi:hypothetical protein
MRKKAAIFLLKRDRNEYETTDRNEASISRTAQLGVLDGTRGTCGAVAQTSSHERLLFVRSHLVFREIKFVIKQ